ncbi:MAG: glycerophosphodiester phosphodiesterase [Elusimicrobia bacterium]|nr:glycerophosphodiester phosphodiesterase [Elusimicrobiota bacterium]
MKPALIAHRGASGYAPENTMAAFERALAMGANSMEFDVQQTKDGKLVVIHDSDLKRVGGVRGRVGAMTWAELSKVDVGAWFGPSFAGQRVPRLEEVLDLAEGRAELQLEIKNPERPYPGIAERVVNLLRTRKAWDGKVCISSFDHECLFLVRTLASWARIGYLVGLTRRETALREVREVGADSVHMSSRQADRRWVEAVHRDKRKAFVYTVNEPKDYERLGRLGVDAVFTNFPDLDREEAAA